MTKEDEEISLKEFVIDKFQNFEKVIETKFDANNKIVESKLNGFDTRIIRSHEMIANLYVESNKKLETIEKETRFSRWIQNKWYTALILLALFIIGIVIILYNVGIIESIKLV